ncbi:hypothetical protein CEXT_806631 [Caerostris extrusa]|uniref:Uncharacterized protein n=1 Tax=Caerostris extrusa TaxID=172846 RepID=A0AAV4UC93_CAEEX|nr:hypothetical protein CEXT_806631 [Caerostris extrusa]
MERRGGCPSSTMQRVLPYSTVARDVNGWKVSHLPVSNQIAPRFICHPVPVGGDVQTQLEKCPPASSMIRV